MKAGRWIISGIVVIACVLIWFVQKNHIAGSAPAHSDVNLGDLDGDGDIDVLFTLAGNASTIWINQGGLQGNIQGKFTASLQRIGNQDSRFSAMGDLDGDGDLDILIGLNQGFDFYVNSGGPQGGWKGNFELQSQTEVHQANSRFMQFQLGDLDSDGDLDAIFPACCRNSRGFSIWINDGSGEFTQLDQYAENLEVRQIDLGDLDGDRDLDIWIVPAEHEQVSDDPEQPMFTDQLWINDGSGHFHDRPERLGKSSVVGLGDLDGDGDLDAGTASDAGLTIWINDGIGHFNIQSVAANPLPAQTLLLGDLDQDHDLDILISTDDQAEVWLNDGLGTFELSAQKIALPGNSALALGDLDGDLDLDLFCGFSENRYRVWWNDGYGRLGLSWR